MPKPSDAGIWFNCSASGIHNAQHAKIEHDEVYSKEGDCAHEVAHSKLVKIPVEVGDIYHDVPVSAEMLTEIDGYVEAVNETPGRVRFYENKVDCSIIYPGMEGCVDAWVMTDDNWLHVFDLKYGHTFVEAEENKALLIYARSIIDRHMKRVPRGVTLHIHQPKSALQGEDVHRSWDITLEELGFWTAQLQDAAKAMYSSDCMYHVGPHCRYCDNRYSCSALLKANTQNLEVIKSYSQPIDMTAEQVALALEMFEIAQKEMKALVTGLEEVLIHKIKKGESNLKYEYIASVGNACWNVDPKVIEGLGKQYKCELSKTTLVTPAQAKNLGVPKAVVDAMILRPQRGPKLKKINMKRARELFAKKGKK